MNELAVQNVAMTPEQVDLIKSTVAKGATNDELQLFLYTAQRTGLDPLTKQIHFVKRKSKKFNKDTKIWEEVDQMTIQTGIDGYRVIAERSGSLAGIDDATYDSEKETHPNKATVTVWKIVNGIRVSFTASARWTEYAQVFEKDEYVDNKKTGKKITVTGPMWLKMPYLMLAKCAEALALRKAFPNDLSGIYTNEEMAQADNPQQQNTTPKDPAQDTPIEGEVVNQVEQTGQQKCPICSKQHNGKYAKCLECWKKERETKDDEPFQS